MVELAIYLPVVFLLVFASLEGAKLLFMSQAVVQSTWEAAKAAARPNGSAASARALTKEVLKSRNITLGQISLSEYLDALENGEVFSVRVSVEGAQKGITNLGPLNGLDISARAILHKEEMATARERLIKAITEQLGSR